MKLTFKPLLIASALAVCSSSLYAMDNQGDRGLQIATEMEHRDTGWKDQEVNVEMTMFSSTGDKSIRYMRNKALEVENNGDKTLVIFDQPADVSGTAFLSFTYKEGSDDQWLFLPALNRVKRIASDNKSGPFMGSDFAYEDITSQEVEKYTYKYIGEDKLGERAMLQIERYPVSETSGYSKQVVWVDAEHYISQKIDYYDRKGSLLKTQEFVDYKLYNNKFWRADKLVMVNHQKKTRTEIELKDYALSAGIPVTNFSTRALTRLR
ncbi:outer membrane lipoprotein-sorting protein [Pseudoalteromonas xiamenensis]|uniref:outer membrane lipoprotein-sorting protein n=1 Tax=Pseudoalteromonas xiamenensis TaxID=882626 RepID=UPI0027E54951|nr:outer membrane lipoprotein-sorting protein [Pseudoalteromonas xiamenensis]WMN58783.1 outer membrane lipoprotein-sorting protein [Pseudoalteromonas xiamenensis]